MWDWKKYCDKTSFFDKHGKHIIIKFNDQASNMRIQGIRALNTCVNYVQHFNE